MVKLLIVISCFIALCAATGEDIFFSEKYIPKPVHIPAATIHNGSYFPKIDHFRPQDTRTAQFVRLHFLGFKKKIFFLLKFCYLKALSIESWPLPRRWSNIYLCKRSWWNHYWMDWGRFGCWRRPTSWSCPRYRWPSICQT